MFPYPENVSSIADLFFHVDELTGGFFGVGILIAVFMVTFISSKSASMEKSLMFSTFISFLSALFLTFAGLLPEVALYVTMVAMIGSIIYAWFLRQEEGV